jgi:hypothetical protein
MSLNSNEVYEEIKPINSCE